MTDKEGIMREKIYKMVHIYEGHLLSLVYKYFMIFAIVLSFIPLTTKSKVSLYDFIEIFCAVIFVLDYLLRWMTADYKFNSRHWSSFIKYPFRFISIIDLITILALLLSISKITQGYKFAEVLSVLRIVRIFRYSKSVRAIIAIFKRSKKSLIAVGTLAIGYIIVSAIVIFNIEPDSFETFYEAVYWATISLTTVGYGDLYPVTEAGRTIAMISSFFGIAIVALPAGVVTAEYMNMINEKTNRD